MYVDVEPASITLTLTVDEALALAEVLSREAVTEEGTDEYVLMEAIEDDLVEAIAEARRTSA